MHIDTKKSAQHSTIWCPHRWSTTIIAGTILWGSHSHHPTISEEIIILWCWCEPLGLLLDRVPHRSANPLQWRVADCLQIWKSGSMSHEQHNFLQQSGAAHCRAFMQKKKTEDPRCFMEITVTVRGSCAKKVQRAPPFFSAYDKPLLFLTCKKSAGKMLQVAAGPLWQRTFSAPDLWKHATGLHLQRMSSASSLLQNDDNGFLLVETR